MALYEGLRQYQIEEIKKLGFNIGDHVWFCDDMENVIEATIENFKLHRTGERIL
jgi:hypothetical protein